MVEGSEKGKSTFKEAKYSTKAVAKRTGVQSIDTRSMRLSRRVELNLQHQTSSLRNKDDWAVIFAENIFARGRCRLDIDT